jgi:EAL domain-containing protein (putative c-di-GMP-specific phosphodiesterase class I)
MAQNLGLGLIAEGIENQGSADLLRSLGCQFGQGFYFSRAVTAGGVATMLGDCGGFSESGTVLTARMLPSGLSDDR